MKRFGLVMAAGLLLLTAVFHAQVSSGILTAGERCVTVLVPSLYCYSIIAGVVTRSGMLGGGKAGMAAVVILSQLGGYPLGAQLVSGMYRSGSLTEAQARQMLCVCIGCGPGFLLGTVCGGLPVGARLWMMASVSLPQLIAALVLLHGIRPGEHRTERLTGTRLLTEAVEAAAGAMLRICSMVLAMAGAMAVLDGSGLFRLAGVLHPKVPLFLRSLLEVSCITDWIPQGGSLPMAAALLTFGGICVHLQIASLCGGLLPWLRFWGIRLLCSVAAYCLCSLGMPLFCRDVQAASLLLMPEVRAHEAGMLPGICLLLMSALLLYRSERVKR